MVVADSRSLSWHTIPSLAASGAGQLQRSLHQAKAVQAQVVGGVLQPPGDTGRGAPDPPVIQLHVYLLAEQARGNALPAVTHQRHGQHWAPH